jgi:hypothetical protein
MVKDLPTTGPFDENDTDEDADTQINTSPDIGRGLTGSPDTAGVVDVDENEYDKNRICVLTYFRNLEFDVKDAIDSDVFGMSDVKESLEEGS